MPNLKLIRYLYGLRDRWILPQAIAGDTQSRIEDVHRAVEGLLREGYPIEYHPSYGYRFRPGDEVIDPERLGAGLDPRRWIGVEIHALREVPSTQDVAWTLLEHGAPSGTVVIAERQRKGRGRFRRPWVSPRGGGLWMSVLLHREAIPRQVSLLTVASAIAVARAVEAESALPARIRWPNDIVIGGRKLGGILIEMRQEGPAPRAAVIGIGINVALDVDDLPEDLGKIATSLAREGSKSTDRSGLARGVLGELDLWLLRAVEGGTDTLGDAWRGLSSNLGKPAALRQNDRRYEGVVVDLDPVGGLSLDLGGGRIRTFPAEQVSLIPG